LGVKVQNIMGNQISLEKEAINNPTTATESNSGIKASAF